MVKQLTKLVDVVHATDHTGDLSYEVEIALDAGIPVLAYLVDPEHPWSQPKEQDLIVDAGSQKMVLQISKNVQALKDFQAFLKNDAGLTCELFAAMLNRIQQFGVPPPLLRHG
jgi:hypothetical protein